MPTCTDMRILDLFCGAGGASMGYHQALQEMGINHEIVGIDINPQPNYPFTFIQADLTTDDPVDPATFDLIHASPPCQAHSTLRHSPGAKETYVDLVATTRVILNDYDRPYVIENVPGAPLVEPTRLCGSNFPDLRTIWQEIPNGLKRWYGLRRHRLFESTFTMKQPACRHNLPVLGVYGDLAKNARKSTRGIKAGRTQAWELMGIDWMTDKELTQAIPPAYSRWVMYQYLKPVLRCSFDGQFYTAKTADSHAICQILEDEAAAGISPC